MFLWFTNGLMKSVLGHLLQTDGWIDLKIQEADMTVSIELVTCTIVTNITVTDTCLPVFSILQ